ncbi:MAG: transporter [Rickettsiales bacterium]|nr:transporter [Rickettsiales bacterium]OUW03791.1 MAG: hypothetical protein CBD16_03000 [Betaproteobacteria bacterium TMED156]
MEIVQLKNVVVIGGFFLGTMFGFIGQRIRFCILGAISDFLIYKNLIRIKIWIVACLTAIASTQILILFNAIRLDSTVISTSEVYWFSNLVGGALFGFGMVLASGCGSRALIRIGEGNLKAVVVILTISISAIVTLRGLLAPIRVNFFEKINLTFPQYIDLISIFSIFFGDENKIRIFFIILSLFLLFILLFFDGLNEKKILRLPKKKYILSVVLGFLIPFGWFITGNVGFIEEHPNTLEYAYLSTNSNSLESFTYVGPLAYSAELLMYWTDSSKKVTFGICLVIGTLFGSNFSALQQNTFKVEGFISSQDFFHHTIGGVLMGIGGVIAVGCSIGHGLSGISFLSISSIITILSIYLGTYLGILYMQDKV